ncbi:MAG TPA: DUF4114 domain-containing protein [Chthoniobacteraceae bacterium]|jgi:hypothetical protein|nr:DUF4114 domain-containing protein [Chthoniobacteraceae bacterium]
MIVRHLAFGIALTIVSASTVLADLVQYNSNPAAYPNVTAQLGLEYGANPVTETTFQYYTVNGAGAATLNMRFKEDLGGYQFNFGAYKVTPALLAIDTSTDAGRIAYANQALAPGNAALIFNDSTQDPGASAALTMIGASNIMGGDTIGFFLIPNQTLAEFQSNPGSFSLTGNGFAQPPNAWPLFGDATANPGGFDQLMSFDGTSIITGNPTSMFAWEDLTRLPGTGTTSDESFSDLIFTVEGVTAAPVPEPATIGFGIALCGALGLSRPRRSASKQ